MKFLPYSLILAAASLHADSCCVKEPEIPPTSDCQEGEDWSLFVRRREVFLNAEFLYWTVNEGALDYALKMKHAAWGPTDAFANGDYKIADYDWCPGLRISGGWYNEPHYWEVLAQYTWFYDHGHDHSHKPTASDRFLNPTWGVFTPSPIATATSNLTLHYHLADLMATRVFDPNPHLRLRIVGGLTFAYIAQKWKMIYNDFGTNSDLIKNRWRYVGGGIRLGIATDWYWTGCMYMTGKVTFATLMGNYENRVFQKTTFNPSPLDNPALPVRNAEYEDYRFAFQAQFLFGPSWQKVYDCWAFEAFVGYEFNVWLNLQEVYRSTQSPPSGANETRMSNGVFGLQGLTARITVGF